MGNLLQLFLGRSLAALEKEGQDSETENLPWREGIIFERLTAVGCTRRRIPSAPNQTYSWSLLLSLCQLWIIYLGKLMERPLITGWLVVEFLDHREQLLFREGGYVSPGVGVGGGEQAVQLRDLGIL